MTLKATRGTNRTLSCFSREFPRAINAGLAVAPFHFYVQDSPTSGAAQADRFISVLRASGYTGHRPGELPPILDFEWRDGGGCWPGPASTVIADAKVWLDRVEAAFGRKPIIYTARGFITSCLGSTTAFAGYPLQVADWGDVSSPRLPPGSTSWLMWQYGCSNVEQVPGMLTSEYCMSVFNGTQADLDALANRTSSGPVELADFTGDGMDDLGAQYRASGELRVWGSTGDFSADGRLFAGPTQVVGTGWGGANVERIVIGDFDGDGKDDIGAQYAGSGDLRAWYSTGDLSGYGRLFAGGPLVGAGWGSANVERILIGDFTGDGKDDLGAQYRSSGELRVWASTGDFSADGRLFAGPTQVVGTGWGSANVERIVVGDFNGDGKDDIGAQYAGSGDLRAWYSTGDLSGYGRLFAGGPLVGAGWGSANVERILIGDFTGDGKDDLGAQYKASGELRVWASTGDFSADGRLFAGPTQVVGTGWGGANVERIVLGDANGDGKTDIGAQYAGSGDLRAWYSTGDLTGYGRLFAGGPLVGAGWGSANVERII